jgi:hypothetical protein
MQLDKESKEDINNKRKLGLDNYKSIYCLN